MAGSRQQFDHKYHSWLIESNDFQNNWRKRNQFNYEYYDGEQWTDEEEYNLNARGQQASVLNIIRPTVDTIIAQERQRQTDIQIVGREESDFVMADIMTKLLKQVYDENSFSYRQGRIFRQGIVGGIGWMQALPVEDDSGQIQIEVIQIPWEEMYWDPYMREPDASDARYLIRRVYVDRDWANEEWGEEKVDKAEGYYIGSTEIDETYEGQEHEARMNTDASNKFDNDWSSNSRRIAVNEVWYKDHDGRIRLVKYSGSVFLEGGLEDKDNEPPYRMNMYPFVPFIASMNQKGLPQGIVDWTKDIQDALNKCYSKWMWGTMSRQVVLEEGAVEDPDEVRQQVAQPDGVVVINEGYWGKFEILDNKNESTHLMEMMHFLLHMVQRISGVNDAVLGLGGVNARSAEQEASRSLAGAQMQTSFLENLFYTKKQMAKVILQLMGEFYTDRRVVRIVEPNGEIFTQALNDPAVDEFTEEQAVDEDTGEPIVMNQVIMDNILRYDVVITHTQPFDTVRDLMMRYLSEMAKAGAMAPEVIGEMMIMLSSMPDKQRLIQKNEEFLRQQAELQQQQMLQQGQA